MLRLADRSKYQQSYFKQDYFRDITLRTRSCPPNRNSPAPLQDLISESCNLFKEKTAVICDGKKLSYRQLDARANQLARYFQSMNITPESRIGILLDRSLNTYITLLAIVKADAVFVPLDTGFPGERINYIARDADLALMVTSLQYSKKLQDFPCPLLNLDNCTGALNNQLKTLPACNTVTSAKNNRLCYIIYTSGSTGVPKGVAIQHSSICNFVQVAAKAYDIQPEDRIYQGMTIAFDFSIEEIWLGLYRGATLIAGPQDEGRFGAELANFLNEKNVTVLCCVPTLLATLDQDIPSLRTLIVGGEACPQYLVERWAKPGRKMLNTYGPTETTVTATWGELYPGKPVTIGKAMPTYTVYILDDQHTPVPTGTPGEICIGGIGLAAGYINQEEKTKQCFIPDRLNTPNNPSGKIYRTGDLGRLRQDGEIEYLGRIDSQVKIRGYRIELTEIESIILESPEVQKVAVAPYWINTDNQELVAYCELKKNSSGLDKERIRRRLANRVPSYMFPAFIEQINALPLLANGKTDRNSLPKPVSSRGTADQSHFIAPKGPIEQRIADTLSDLLGQQQISVTDDFFNDLGAHSLLMAKLVSTLRRDKDMATLSLADLYQHCTIRKLARHVADLKQQPQPEEKTEKTTFPVYSDAKVWGCGLLQLTALLLIYMIFALPALYTLNWLNHSVNWNSPDFLLLAGIGCMGILATLGLSLTCPVLYRYIFFKDIVPGTYPLWGFFFLRFWIMDKLLTMAPLALFSGTPILAAYYRLLGAQTGKNVIIDSSFLHLPEMTTLADGCSVNTGSHLFGYCVEENLLHIQPVVLEKNCTVGSNTVLMPGSAMNKNSILGDQSLLGRGCTVPQNEYWAGSPACPNKNSRGETPTGGENTILPKETRLPWLRFLPAILILPLIPYAASFPVIFLLLTYRVRWPFMFAAAPLAAVAFILFLHLFIIGLNKLLRPHIQPGMYSLSSRQYLQKFCIDRLMELSLGLTNSLYATLYLAPFLRQMGAKIGNMAEISTISHITPDLLEIDDESFVADIAHIGPARIAHGHFSVAPVRIGKRSFIGNAAFIPGNTNVADNSLIGVLSTVPGKEVPRDTTWLGSPPILLPEREPSKHFPENRTFKPTIGLYAGRLFHEYFRVTGPATLVTLVTLLLLRLGIHLLAAHGVIVTALLLTPVALITALLLTLFVAGCKKILIGGYRPRVRPMWSSFVWRSELVTALYENIAVPLLLAGLTGTPFMQPLLCLFGVKIGARCFIETTFLTEFDLVTTGTDCSIGKFCSLQTHLFEDRVMKMSYLKVGNRCSIGPRAVILYDSVLEDHVTLEAMSLVMKGETLSQDSCWSGSPAASGPTR